jgi:ankyrin repeat protein
VNRRNEEGQAPLHWSAQGGNVAVAKALVAHGTETEPVDFDTALPIHWAGS